MNIEELMEMLPEGYEEACREKGAMRRKREIKNPQDLMKLCLIYLSQKCSLVEISEIARLMGIGEMSDVAFMKRFAKCGEWFKWILGQMTANGITNYQKPKSMEGYDFVALDASDIVEKGASKRVFRLHYAINIFTMTSLEYKITTEQVGESLTNFTIKPNYLVIADRAYGNKKGIEYCLENGGNFIFRIKNKAFNLYDENRKEINLLEEIKNATDKKAIDKTVYMENSKKELVELRVCAIRKTDEKIKESNKKLQRKEIRKQVAFSEETKKSHEYIFVITSLPKSIGADEILSAYRFRWQIELYFKRLKSIMDLGDLPKKKDDGIIAWLHGKLIVALLLEKLLSDLDFSPSA